MPLAAVALAAFFTFGGFGFAKYGAEPGNFGTGYWGRKIKDPAERPFAAELKRHAFVRGARPEPLRHLVQEQLAEKQGLARRRRLGGLGVERLADQLVHLLRLALAIIIRVRFRRSRGRPWRHPTCLGAP